MPVLSEQIADVDPSVSTDRSRLTMAPSSASSRVPNDSRVVTTAGSPVGMAEIARLMPTMNSSSKSSPRMRPRMMISARAIAAMIVISTVSWSSWRVSGVFSCSTPLNMLEMWPTSVDMPVDVTIISPRPRVTCEFMNAMSWRSPRATSSPAIASITLDDGVLSPVSPDSSISSVAATRRRPSAGTLSPASNPTMSPGTSSSAGTRKRSPPRRTLAEMISIWRSAATLSAALPSWCRPSRALKTVIARTTSPVEMSWMAMMLTSAAPTSTSCMRSRYWRRNAFHVGSLATSASLFDPY